jgi:hypothetical protein
MQVKGPNLIHVGYPRADERPAEIAKQRSIRESFIGGDKKYGT